MLQQNLNQSKQNILRALSGAVVLLLLTFSTEVGMQIYIGSIRVQVRQSLLVERNLNALLNAVKDAETGQRGYVITGKKDYLEPYVTAEARADGYVETVERILLEKGETSPEFTEITEAIAGKFRELSMILEIYDSGDRAGAIATLDQDEGEEIMDNIRAMAGTLTLHWEQEIDELRKRIDWLYKFSTLLNLLSFAALIAITFYLYSKLTPLVSKLSDTLELSERELAQSRKLERQRTQLINELKVKNEELDRFAHIASHDLQEPLRTVSNFVDLIDEEYGDQLGDDGKTYFGFINKATDRMRLLIDNLLKYSQLGRGADMAPAALDECALAAIQNLSAAIDDRRASVKVEPLPIVSGYAVELTRLLQNLISNAIKFTPPERTPVINISCTETDRQHVVHVRDNGIGINAATREKVFNLFSRVHADGDYEGVGIGLTVARRIVEMHGGQLTVASTPNAGSVFSFTLPKSHDETKTQESTTD